MIGTTPRIRIEFGANGITVHLSGRSDIRLSVEYALPAEPERYADTLFRAFSEAKNRLESEAGSQARHTRVDAVLLPPIADARLVPLPPLRRAEAEAVLRRDAARYFIGGAGPLAIAARMPARDRRGSVAHAVFAVSAPAAFVDAVCRAASSVNWRIHSIRPAHAHWISAARSHALDDAELPIVCVVDGTAHVLHMRGNDVVALRRIPADAFSELADVLRGSATFAVVGDRARAACAHPAFAQQRMQVIADDAVERPGRSLDFVTPAMEAFHAQRRRAWASRLAAAAALIALISAAVHYWGLMREIALIEERRAEIRQEVAPLLAWRDSLLGLEERLALLERVHPKPGRLTRALFDVSVLLPPDAHLTAFRSKGDTLMISGLSPRAADAIQALRSALSFGNVRLDGIIDRELDAGATAQERFNIEALLTAPDSVDRPRPRTPAMAAARSGS